MKDGEQGVVFRVRPYGERDLLVVLFGKTQGRLPLIARGGRKLGSRVHAVLQPFRVVEVRYRKTREVGTVSQAELLERFPPLEEDPVRFAWAAYGAELLEHVGEDRDARALYDVYLWYLRRLAGNDPPELVAAYVELATLRVQGLAPELHRCARCGREDVPLVAFSSDAGGAVCADCIPLLPDAYPLSSAALYFLRAFAQLPPGRIGRLMAKPDTIDEVARHMDAFLAHHWPAPLYAKRVAREISRPLLAAGEEPESETAKET
ncbi:MAG TPA: DNA repair protein RecO [Bacillaceae bacterium]|nr:DNA repair protein RecO [Bacillaceae bacterium]